MPARKKVIVVAAPEKAEEYRTSDLYLAAYIIACQRRMLRHERAGQKVTFVFDREASTLRSSWVDSSGVVNAQAFATAIKNLKHLVAHED